MLREALEPAGLFDLQPAPSRPTNDRVSRTIRPMCARSSKAPSVRRPSAALAFPIPGASGQPARWLHLGGNTGRYAMRLADRHRADAWRAVRTMPFEAKAPASACSTISPSRFDAAGPRGRGNRSRCPPGRWHREHLRRRSSRADPLDARREQLSLPQAAQHPRHRTRRRHGGCTISPGAPRIVLPRVFDLASRTSSSIKAGVDALATDKLGRLALTHDGLRQRDAMVFAAVRQAGVPMVITLGGGYSDPIEATVAAHANTFPAPRQR